VFAALCYANFGIEGALAIFSSARAALDLKFLCEFPPDFRNFKSAARGGNWFSHKIMLRRTIYAAIRLNGLVPPPSRSRGSSAFVKGLVVGISKALAAHETGAAAEAAAVIAGRS